MPLQTAIRPVIPANFADLATLFEARGGPHFCWCMAFRDKPKEDMSQPPAQRKAWRKGLLQARVEAGQHVGLLAYRDGAPVGWCSRGPLAGFRRLGGPKDGDPVRSWAISCFFIPRAYRGQGLMRGLAMAAIEAARGAGAAMMQVTPVAPDAPSYRFMGYVPLFESLGFDHVARAGHRRHVMRLELR